MKSNYKSRQLGHVCHSAISICAIMRKIKALHIICICLYFDSTAAFVFQPEKATMPIKEQKGENESRTLVSACVSILPLEPRVVQLFRRFCNMPQSDGGRGKGASNPAHLLWKPHSNNLATNEQLILK